MFSTSTKDAVKTGKSVALARERKGMKQKELAEKLGVTAAYISGVENGRPLKEELAKRIEAVLGELPDDPFSYAVAAFMAGSRVNEATPVYSTGEATVPLYRQVVRAGTGTTAFEDDIVQFDIGKHYAGTAVYEIAGDSMIDAGIEEGDRVVVKLGYKFRQRAIILCKFKGELMVKGAAIINDSIWCFPANEHYHPWECKESDEFECIGTVIEIIKHPHTEWWKRHDFKTLGKNEG
jgi:SOS-response transcriptional repressor LexA